VQVQQARWRGAPAHPASRACSAKHPLIAFTEVAMQTALTVLDRFGRRDASAWLGVPSLSIDEEGQDLLEYAVLCALIAIVALGAVQAVGNTINNVFWSAIAASSV
jgi:Flp pilus assembly pilin Flp